MNTDLSVYASENLCYRPTSIFFFKTLHSFSDCTGTKTIQELGRQSGGHLLKHVFEGLRLNKIFISDVIAVQCSVL